MILVWLIHNIFCNILIGSYTRQYIISLSLAIIIIFIVLCVCVFYSPFYVYLLLLLLSSLFSLSLFLSWQKAVRFKNNIYILSREHVCFLFGHILNSTIGQFYWVFLSLCYTGIFFHFFCSFSLDFIWFHVFLLSFNICLEFKTKKISKNDMESHSLPNSWFHYICVCFLYVLIMHIRFKISEENSTFRTQNDLYRSYTKEEMKIKRNCSCLHQQFLRNIRR